MAANLNIMTPRNCHVRHLEIETKVRDKNVGEIRET